MIKRQHVLVVEDDGWLAEQYARVLDQSGYTVSIARHALAAVDLIDKTKPVVIVLDMLLAGYDALALLHELQSYKDTAAIPIILCTNLASDLKLEDLEPYGVRRLIDKATMQPDDIVAAVRAVAP